VEITHANLFAQLRTFVDHYGLGDDTHLMNPLLMHHADGLVQGPVLALFAGGRLYRPRRFTVENMPDCADAIYRERITHFVAVPTILALMLRLPGEYDDAFRTPDFRFVCSTAAPLEEGMWSRFEERFGTMVVNSYGLTETVCEGLYCGPDPATRRLGTIGKPVGCEARVVDGSGEAVGRNEVGELILRGANVMRGYFRQPEASAAVLRDGWLHTGDLATVDDEGYFRIVGRIKNMIGRGGFNIYPEDITRTLLGLDGILDAVTFGLEDPVWGERIVSCVIADGTVPLSVETVFAHCRENLSPEKVPDEVHVFDSLPRGPAGKVVLEQVRDRVRELHRQRAAPAGSDVDSRVLGIAARVFRVPVDTLSQGSTAQTTPGWDSLAHVTLVEEVESEFDIRLGTREMLAIHRLGDVAAMVRERRAGARTAPAGST
jgi:long-chain acyl-CoA synthetase